MADECDVTEERESMVIAATIERTANQPPEAVSIGFCLACGPTAPVPAGHRWCNAECRDSWQEEQNFLKRSGGRG